MILVFTVTTARSVSCLSCKFSVFLAFRRPLATRQTDHGEIARNDAHCHKSPANSQMFENNLQKAVFVCSTSAI